MPNRKRTRELRGLSMKADRTEREELRPKKPLKKFSLAGREAPQSPSILRGWEKPTAGAEVQRSDGMPIRGNSLKGDEADYFIKLGLVATRVQSLMSRRSPIPKAEDLDPAAGGLACRSRHLLVRRSKTKKTKKKKKKKKGRRGSVSNRSV